MSRYYDPITHRFVNADGYFQSGGSLLDTNMNSYCRNNPVNCYDPTGSSCKEHGSYYVPTCTYCSPDRRNYLNTKRGMDYYNQKNGTNYIGVDNSGNFVKRNFSQKVVDSVGALFYSAQLNADVGLGFGGEVTVLDNVKATAIIEKHAYMLRVNENGFDYGLVKGSNAGITVGPVNVYSTGYTDFESYVTGKHTTFCGDSHFVGFSAGVYVGAGASIQIGWDLDYYNNKVNEIWR